MDTAKKKNGVQRRKKDGDIMPKLLILTMTIKFFVFYTLEKSKVSNYGFKHLRAIFIFVKGGGEFLNFSLPLVVHLKLGN